jgi:hypothetical protein
VKGFEKKWIQGKQESLQQAGWMQAAVRQAVLKRCPYDAGKPGVQERVRGPVEAKNKRMGLPARAC